MLKTKSQQNSCKYDGLISEEYRIYYQRSKLLYFSNRKIIKTIISILLILTMLHYINYNDWIGSYLIDKTHLKIKQLSTSPSLYYADDNNLLPNKYTPSVLIGLGCMKSGSTYFEHALSAASSYDDSDINNLLDYVGNLQNSSTTNDIIFVRPTPFVFDYQKIKDETRYWTNCIMRHLPLVHGLVHDPYWNDKNANNTLNDDCTWNDFISTNWNPFWKKIANADLQNKIILTEKSPSYIKIPHTAQLLGYISGQVSLKMYVIIRDPIERLKSHYWHNCYRLGQKCDNKITNWATHDVRQFPVRFPNFYKIIQLLNDFTKSDDEIDDEMIDLYIKDFYSIQNLKEADIIFSSCYYPQIKLWWKYLQNKNSLRIIQNEYLPKNTSKMVYHLKCWVNARNNNNNNNDYDCNGVEFINVEAENTILTQQRTKGSLARTHADEQLPDDIIEKLQYIYHGCNERLYRFIQKNSYLMLGNENFIPWE